MENDQRESLIQMNLDYDGGHILLETIRWSRFLAIVGIIALSIYLLILALAGSAIFAAFGQLVPGAEELGGTEKSIIMIVLLLFFGYFGFVVIMLYRFSILTRRAIDQRDQVAFSRGMKSLNTYFLLYAIFGVLILLANIYSLIKAF